MYAPLLAWFRSCDDDGTPVFRGLLILDISSVKLPRRDRVADIPKRTAKNTDGGVHAQAMMLLVCEENILLRLLIMELLQKELRRAVARDHPANSVTEN